MKQIILLLSLVLLIGCVPQAAMEDDYSPKVKIVEEVGEVEESTETVKNEEAIVIDKEEGEEKAEEKKKLALHQDDIIEVKTYGDYSKITKAVIYGEVMDGFRVEYTDRDALIFEIKKNYALTMDQTRLITVIDGLPYLNKKEKQLLEQEVEVEEADEEVTEDVIRTVGYIAEKEDGFIRAVGCDLETKTLTFKLQNIEDKTVRLFKNVKPTPKNALSISLNRKSVQKFACLNNTEEMPEYDDVVQCYSQPVYLMKNEGLTGQDTLALNKPGHVELFKFSCTTPPEE